jgi:hypothetical protein
MATKLEICARRVNDEFSHNLAAKFSERFSRDLETRFDIFSMQLVSAPMDGEPFTPEQHAWVTAWSDGYGEALDVVRRLAAPRLPA